MKRLEFLDGGTSAFIGFDDRFVGTRISALVADSIDRRNALAKSFCRRFEAECLSGPFVQPASDGIELALMNIRQVHAFWEVLAQQTLSLIHI